MRMKQLTFNFHNHLGFVLETRDEKCARFFQSEFDFAPRGVGADLPVVKLRWDGESVRGETGRGMLSASHRLIARWHYDMQIEPRAISIRVAGNGLSIPMVYHMMVHPSLRILVSEVDEILLHGAAVVFEGRSLVLTGEGGAGKTTTTTLLLAKGGPRWNLHADDYVFIARDKTTYAYLTRSHLYKKMVRWLPDMAKRLTLWERIQLEGLGWALDISGQRLKWPVRLEPSRLWPTKEIAEAAHLSAVVILERSSQDSLQLRRIPADQIPIERLMGMNFREAAHFERLAERVEGLPRDWRRSWRAREQAVLERLREGTDFYELRLPECSPSAADLAGQVVDSLVPLIKEDSDQPQSV
jgi:hypothetical protein